LITQDHINSNFGKPKNEKPMLKISRLFLILFASQLLFFSCKPVQPKQNKIKYAFLFIGDGMGVAQVNATEAYIAAINNEKGFHQLSFTQFPNAGLVSTYADNRFITCSAAAGTAFATGYKTNIGHIATDTSGTVPFRSIATICKEQGMKVGILSCVSINHATPAVFYAHQPDRDNYFEIGVDLANSSVDFFGGGGIDKAVGMIDGKEVNAVELAKENGFTFINTVEDFKNLKKPAGKILAVSPVLTSSQAMPYSIDMVGNELALADFTSKAIEMLDNENGFFMMVEGGKIDWAAHDNDAASVIHEVVSFDDAVAVAKKFYDLHPDETLIVITADHETGGMSLGNRNMKYETNLAILANQKISLEAMIKLENNFKKELKGNKQEDFAKMMLIVSENFGLGDSSKIALTDKDFDQLQESFKACMYSEEIENTFTKKVIALMSEKAGIGWTTGSHTGINIPIYAIGPGAELFSGVIDNTDIPKITLQLLGIKETAAAAK
jgi:alkaline phosphatase